MRILVFTSEPAKWSNLTIAGDDADLAEAWIFGNQIFTAEQLSTRDYDLFITVDLEVNEQLTAAPFYDQSDAMHERLNSGARVVVIAINTLRGINPLQWPANHRALPTPSHAITVDDTQLFGAALKRYENRLYCEVDWRRKNPVLARSKTDYSVAETINSTLLLPRLDGDERAMLKAVVESEPGWFPDAPATPSTAPEWANDVSRWPALVASETAAAEAAQALTAAREQKEHAEQDLGEERRWLGLLYERGKKELEPLVHDALVALGLPVVKPQNTGIQDLDLETAEFMLVIEIGGSKNEIGIDKGTQVYRWAGAEEQRLIESGSEKPVRGAVIGNGFCERPLAERPVDQFSDPLWKFAERHDYRLMATHELFRLVTERPSAALDDVRRALGVDAFY